MVLTSRSPSCVHQLVLVGHLAQTTLEQTNVQTVDKLQGHHKKSIYFNELGNSFLPCTPLVVGMEPKLWFVQPNASMAWFELWQQVC